MFTLPKARIVLRDPGLVVSCGRVAVINKATNAKRAAHTSRVGPLSCPAISQPRGNVHKSSGIMR
jgi:hypothetical protein